MPLPAAGANAPWIPAPLLPRASNGAASNIAPLARSALRSEVRAGFHSLQTLARHSGPWNRYRMRFPISMSLPVSIGHVCPLSGSQLSLQIFSKSLRTVNWTRNSAFLCRRALWRHYGDLPCAPAHLRIPSAG